MSRVYVYKGLYVFVFKAASPLGIPVFINLLAIPVIHALLLCSTARVLLVIRGIYIMAVIKIQITVLC